jgi:hypothetical protein
LDVAKRGHAATAFSSSLLLGSRGKNPVWAGWDLNPRPGGEISRKPLFSFLRTVVLSTLKTSEGMSNFGWWWILWFEESNNLQLQPRIELYSTTVLRG